VAGASGSGKTRFATSLLSNPASPWKYVVWVSSERSADQEDVRRLAESLGPGGFKLVEVPVNVSKGSPQEERAVQEVHAAIKANKAAGRVPQMVVLDDLMKSSIGVKNMSASLFTTVRHSGGSIMELLQRMATGDKTNRINSSIFVLFKMGAAAEVMNTFKDLFPGSEREMFKLYREEIARSPHGYILVDTQGSHRDGRSGGDPLQVRCSHMRVGCKEFSKL
jgi:hypothetical protein